MKDFQYLTSSSEEPSELSTNIDEEAEVVSIFIAFLISIEKTGKLLV